MVFSSQLFLFYFLSAALALYYALWRASQRWRNAVLVLLGYIFYGWANPAFVFLMFATTFIDWLLSLVVAQDSWRFWRGGGICRTLPDSQDNPRTSRQRWALALSVISNLASLGFFKYFNFGLDSYNRLVTELGLAAWRWDTFFRVILPLGISFYTFQSLSYTIDVYRGHARAMRNFIDFSCFVSMFPHLVAGPILKFSFLSEQLTARTLTLEKFARGVAFLSLGLAKKILLANACGKVADTVFGAAAAPTLDAWCGVLAYAFQIYFDFSGYSDMAIGLGLMLGFVFAKNFDSPYRAISLTDFWRRWHISLSTWLREYLYVPLGGNRRGPRRTYVNLLLTMLLGGLWHGASWNFVIWGGLHGSVLAAERACGKQSFYRALPGFIKVAVTFFIVLVGWVVFRTATLAEAGHYGATLLGIGPKHAAAGLLAGIIYQPYYLGTLLVAAVIAFAAPQTWDFTRHITWPKAAIIMCLLWLSLTVLFTQAYNPFIYFVF